MPMPDSPRAPAAADYLRIENVSKTFGPFRALDDVSLTIEAGEFVCFLGPSGCGKTTLLRAISGLDAQTSGTILQNGRDISPLPPARRDFGIVFQSYALFPNLSVFDNVAYGLKGLGRARAAARVSELLELVGLPEQAAKFPAQLSGGQQQRVALARALAPSPGLLLLDEPLSALDARVRTRLRGEIRRLHRQLNLTTIMVTHDQEEALTMADRIVVMNEGRIDQVGTPLEIYGAPATLFVADFIGRINRLPGRMVGPRTVDLGGVPLEIGAALAGGGEVIACLRPEDIVTCPPGAPATNTYSVLVAELEFLGSHYVAGLRFPASDLTMRAEFAARDVVGLRMAEGTAIDVHIPPDRVRLYGAAGGRGLAAAP